MFKKQIFQHESAISEYPNIITLAKDHIPEWYKKITPWRNNEIFTFEGGFQHSVKKCMPFLDSLTTGYMIVLPYDIYVKNNNGIQYMFTKNNLPFSPIKRDSPADLKLVPFEHSPEEWAWQTGIATMVPKGYSVLYTHPLNRHDLPFTTISGIIDGGFITSPGGSIPFYLKKDFEGVIPQGTPILQLIPFREETWLSKITKGLVEKSIVYNNKSNFILSGFYKKNFWTRKKYL